ncbi:MAG: hypothetical protein IPM43_09485 [Actinomycetota bacterium]|nr:MAG: hypothetical protein IPM43_09485 [Actinomycetota bacterium]
MKNPRTVMHSIVATLIAALATIALAPTATAADLAIAPESVVASFEGGRIRLADGWGDAHACLSDDDGTRCYRTKGEMNRVEELDTQPLVLLVGWGGPLYLYTGSSYTGNTLALSTWSDDQPVAIRIQQRHVELPDRTVLGPLLRHHQRRNRLPRQHKR